MKQNIDRAFKQIDKSTKDMETKTRKGTKPRQTNVQRLNKRCHYTDEE